MVRDRLYFWLTILLLSLTIPARLARLNNSLWLDEAWVANSLVTPSFHDMFFFPAWVQVNPPLLLLWERWTIDLAGTTEIALRLVPEAAVLAGLVIAAIALRRWLCAPAALAAFTLLCVNYWLIKYSQEVKEYATDFLVSVVLMKLLGRYLRDATGRRRYLTLAGAAAAGMFLAYTAVFWIPGLVAASALTAEAGGLEWRRWRDVAWRRVAGAAGLWGLVFVSVDVVFIRTNETAKLRQYWQPDFLDLSHPLATAWQAVYTLGRLLEAGGPLAGIVGLGGAAFMGAAAFQAVVRGRAGEPAGRMVVLAGVFPLASVAVAAGLRAYPVLEYPRLLVFSLPSLALLTGYGVDLLLRRIAWSAAARRRLDHLVVGGCAAAALASQVLFAFTSHSHEDNRPAMKYIGSRLRPDDVVFVHGGMYEQFEYYGVRLDIHPKHVYIGNEDWPCCVKGDIKKATDPSVWSFEDDLREAAERARGRRLWLLMPAGDSGHWSSGIRGKIDAVPRLLEADGCTWRRKRLFGQTLVERWRCDSPSQTRYSGASQTSGPEPAWLPVLPARRD